MQGLSKSGDQIERASRIPHRHYFFNELSEPKAGLWRIGCISCGVGVRVSSLPISIVVDQLNFATSVPVTFHIS